MMVTSITATRPETVGSHWKGTRKLLAKAILSILALLVVTQVYFLVKILRAGVDFV